jgi:hypothetical protein
LGIVAFWALMTHHCGLEAISGLEFLACAPESEATPHQPADCGDESDSCATVESGHYRVEEGQITAAKPPITGVALAFAILSDLALVESSARRISPEPSPPELARVWQFCFRAALPVRAPSSAS